MPQSGLSATAARMSVDIRRLPWIRPLAADYAFHFDKVADFFAGDPSSRQAWDDAIVAAQRRPASPILADALDAQLQRRAAPAEARAAARRLREPGAVAIVTGQQAGLFGGPLFTLLKAVTALQLASRVAREHRVPAVPVFWIDSEDHDWDEVRSCGVLDAEAALQRVGVASASNDGHVPVARVTLDASVDAALQALAATLPATDFTASLLERLRQAYRPGAGMADAFGRWLDDVLGGEGLVVFEASDPAVKPLAAPIFTAEIAHAGRTNRLAAEAGARLEARGYHAQVDPAADGPALFHLDGSRQPIRRQGDRFQWGGQTMAASALQEQAARAPEAFSPNVLLRPVVQDTLFPTICYVAGPNELGYLAQLRSVYDAFGVPMPLIYPRASATLIDSNAARFLTRHNVALETLHPRDDAALNELLAAQLPPTVDQALRDVTAAVQDRMGQLASAVHELDATLEGAARSTLGRMQDDVKKLHSKIIQAAKRKDETLRRQFTHAKALTFPQGEPQERALGFVYFLNREGSALVPRLRDEVPLDLGSHWIVTL